MFRERLLNALRSIPAWIKWLGGIVPLASILAGIRREPRIFFGAALAVIVGLAVYLCFIVLTAKEPSPLVGAPPTYAYKRYRPFAALGLAAIALGLIVTLSLPAGRSFLFSLFGGAPLRADVLIGKFDSKYASRRFEIAARIEADLKRRLRQHNLADVSVVVIDGEISSDAKALSLLGKHRSQAVIWGWYDDVGITVKVLMPGESQGLVVGDVPWQLAGSDNASLSMSFVRKDLPQQVSFLSLFIIGHLYYRANQSERGRLAFDAAMRAIPATLPSDNRSIFHFFRARNLHREYFGRAAPPSPVVDQIVCDYIRALQEDPDNPAAYAIYNNIGVLLAYETLEISPAGNRCLEATGIDYLSAESFFERASQLNPTSVVIAFNRTALRWKQAGGYAYAIQNGAVRVEFQEIETELQHLKEKDSSIPGIHVLLGVLAFDNGRWNDAASNFESAVRLQPRSSRLLFNLAQAYLHSHWEGDTRRLLINALRLDSTDLEVRLALAALDVREGDRNAALKQLDIIRSIDEREETLSTEIALLRSQVLFEIGDIESAAAVLSEHLKSLCEHCFPSALETYLRGLLLRLAGHPEESAQAWQELGAISSTTLDLLVANTLIYNDSAELAWWDIVGRCADGSADASSGAWRADFSSWGESNRCLPHDLRERIREVFTRFHHWLLYRLYYRAGDVPEGMACPHLYTWDDAAKRWRWETTMLTGLDNASMESMQRTPLAGFEGAILIREVEPEISYIDYVWVEVVDRLGRRTILKPANELLRASDGRYVVLRQGDQLVLKFPYVPTDDIMDVNLEAKGYYTPMPGRQTSARRRTSAFYPLPLNRSVGSVWAFLR